MGETAALSTFAPLRIESYRRKRAQFMAQCNAKHRRQRRERHGRSPHLSGDKHCPVRTPQGRTDMAAPPRAAKISLTPCLNHLCPIFAEHPHQLSLGQKAVNLFTTPHLPQLRGRLLAQEQLDR